MSGRTFGAVPLGDGRVRFRFWAPARQRVELAIEGHPPQPMHRLDQGWFEIETDCPAGARYRYRLDDGRCVPDPASARQPEDPQGPSVVVDHGAYRWRNPAWRGRPWEETVLYELHPGICGGFAGIAAMLPRLADLGITAVELMPVNEFPGRRNWGYDGVLPYAPDAAYGTPDELKAMVDRAHGLGLMMFLDVVYNHFGPEGNWLDAYAPGMFRTDVETPWGRAIDFRRPQVRAFFAENVRQWLVDYRFDGLRFDAVQALGANDWLVETARMARAAVGPERHIHLVVENEHNEADLLRHGFDAQWNDDGHHAFHTLLTGERSGYYGDFADRPAERLARCLAEGFAYQGEPSAYAGRPRGTPTTGLPPTAFVLFLQNHDQIGNRAFGDRLTTLARPAALEAAIAVQMLCPQIPMLFMGEEVATKAPFQFFTDYRGDLADAVREGRRREFKRFPAFADPAQQERIPDPNAEETFRRSVPVPDAEFGEARRGLYRRLLELRRQAVVPRLAGTRSLGARALAAGAVEASWRMGDGRILHIAMNLAETAVPASHPGAELVFESTPGAAERLRGRQLAGDSTVVLLGGAG